MRELGDLSPPISKKFVGPRCTECSACARFGNLQITDPKKQSSLGHQLEINDLVSLLLYHKNTPLPPEKKTKSTPKKKSGRGSP